MMSGLAGPLYQFMHWCGVGPWSAHNVAGAGLAMFTMLAFVMKGATSQHIL